MHERIEHNVVPNKRLTQISPDKQNLKMQKKMNSESKGVRSSSRSPDTRRFRSIHVSDIDNSLVSSIQSR